MVSPQPITVNLNEHISCRLYNDTRPHCLETAALQKGLVLIVDGKEVIEEGVGFGVPVVLYKDEPYFSSSAECSILNDGNRKILVKSFVMDTVSRKRFGKNVYVNDGVYSLLHKAQQDLFGFRTYKTYPNQARQEKRKLQSMEHRRESKLTPSLCFI